MVQNIILKAITQLFKKYSVFIEREGSSPCSQKPAIRPYPEPAQSSLPHRSLRSSLMLSSHLRLGLPSGLLPLGLPTKTL
jgi:hypothetical protein